MLESSTHYIAPLTSCASQSCQLHALHITLSTHVLRDTYDEMDVGSALLHSRWDHHVGQQLVGKERMMKMDEDVIRGG